MLYELVEMEAPMFRALTMVVLLVTVALATPSLSAAPADPEVQKPIDTLDAALQPRLERLGLRVEVTNTIMRTLADKQALAQTMLALARKCQP